MKKVFLLIGLTFLVAAGLYAKKIVSMVVPSDLYAKNPAGGGCIRVVNTSYCLSSFWETGTSGFQAALVGTNNLSYNLYEDSSCTVPVYFN